MNHAISVRLTEYLLSQAYDNQNIQCVKVAYSIECILDEFEKLLVALCVFLILHQTKYFIICYLTTVLIRSFLGGIHMKTVGGCLVFSIVIYIIAIYCGKYVMLPFPFDIFVIMGEAICICKYTPVPSKSRPRYTEKQKRRFMLCGLLGEAVCIILGIFFTEIRNTMLWMMILQQLEVQLALKLLRKEGKMYEHKY